MTTPAYCWFVFHGRATGMKGLYCTQEKKNSKLGTLDTENTHKKWFKQNTALRRIHMHHRIQTQNREHHRIHMRWG